jgi:hypothetical protein
MKPYTVVITSCARFDLLERTLSSLCRFLDGPCDRFLVIEDSGDESVRDVVTSITPDAQVLVNPRRLGQLASIDRAYAQVQTPWIFHCEDDWEFTDGKFVQDSHSLLQEFPELSLISLRPRGELNRLVRNAPPRQLNDVGYFRAEPFAHPEYFGYSFNPGLRRREDYLRVGPFVSFRGERDISYCFKKLGYTMGYLERHCVQHIGDERHVDDPRTHKRARTMPQRLAHSVKLRLDRLHRNLFPGQDPAMQILQGEGEFAETRFRRAG